MLRREWNTIATLAVVVTLAYVGGAVFAMVAGKIEFTVFAGALAPVVTAIGGWMARGAGVSE